MEIVIVVLLVVILAALVFAWTKFRPGAAGAGSHPERGGGMRDRRQTAVAGRDDSMAEAVQRHAMATDPQEAAHEELRLQAQANRVASDLHARQAATLESEAHGRGGYSDTSTPVYQDGQPVYQDGQQQPVYEDGRPVYRDGSPVHEDDRRAY